MEYPTNIDGELLAKALISRKNYDEYDQALSFAADDRKFVDALNIPLDEKLAAKSVINKAVAQALRREAKKLER